MATEDQKAVDEFLGDLKQDGTENPLEQSEKDPFEQQPQAQDGSTQAGESSEKEEKVIPFHKDPRIKRMIEKGVEERLAAERARTQLPAQDTADNSFVEVMDAFKSIVGNDTPEKVNALNQLEKALGGLDERATNKAFERLQSIQQAEEAEKQQYENMLNDGFDDIAAETGVDLLAPENKRTRLRFLNFVEQIGHKNADGDIDQLPDLPQAFKVFQASQKTVDTRAKDIADRSMQRGGAPSSKPKQWEVGKGDPFERAAAAIRKDYNL